WKYLFLRAYRNWDFPKGEGKLQEDPLKTAQREVKEETGISDLKFNWGKIYKETEPYRKGKKIARYYIAETSHSKVTFSINPEIGRPEHHEYRWLSYEQLNKLAPSRLKPIIEWAHDVVENND
ncbi:NUDIX domain-containing protein, partial [bacterium]|nr:NUDIX domain-containing protein [bacterium]